MSQGRDNSATERALRRVVVGRKNHYGSRSKWGADVAALFYTRFESAKLAGVDPHRYVLTLRTGQLTPWWANGAGLLAITMLYLWYRRRPQTRSSVGAHGTALVATLALLAPIAYGMSSTIWWLSLVAFTMVLLGRRSEAWVWGIAIPVLVGAASVAEPFVRLPGAAAEPPLERVFARLVFVVIIVGVAGAFRRIANQRAVALRASENRFSQMAGTIDEVFWMATPEADHIFYVNPAFERLFGLPCESLLQDPKAWLRAVHPDDYDRVDAFMKLRLVQGGDIEYRIVRPDGSTRWVWDHVTPTRNEQGRVNIVVGTVRDVTDRWRAEELMRVRLRLLQYAESHTLNELLQLTLDDVGNLTGSPIGFCHFVEADQKTLSLQAWSTQTLERFCRAEGNGRGANRPASAGRQIRVRAARQPDRWRAAHPAGDRHTAVRRRWRLQGNLWCFP